MVTIDRSYEHLTEVNRSKFLGHLVPMAQFEGLQERLRSEHPKASHVVYAWRHLNAYDQVVENSSDDGEPRGAAGTPILNVLRGEEAIECAVVIVRYFGGIKLGIGGMVRAYTLAAKNLVEQARWQPYHKEVQYPFATSYQQIRQTEYHLEQVGITQVERTFEAEGVRWMVRGSEEQITLLRSLLES